MSTDPELSLHEVYFKGCLVYLRLQCLLMLEETAMQNLTEISMNSMGNIAETSNALNRLRDHPLVGIRLLDIIACGRVGVNPNLCQISTS
jgi:hypothetical protein